MIGAKIAVQTKCLAQPLKQALHTVGRLEADGVQIDLRQELFPAELSDTALRQVRKLLDDLNLRIGSVVFPTRRGYANPQNLQRRIEATVEALHAASRLKAGAMLITLGSLPADGAAGTSSLIEVLQALASQGNRLGVRLALQSTASPNDLNRLLEALPEGIVGVDLHPADVLLAGGSPRTFAAMLGPRIAHLFANDAVRGFGGAGGNEVELGRGAVDFPELLAVLEECNYRDWITIERRGSTHPVEEAANAVRFLRSL